MAGYGFGVADGLAALVGVGVAVFLGVGLGVAVAFGLSVGVGPSAGGGVGVSVTKIILIAPSSGTGETTGFLRKTRILPMSMTKHMNSTMSVTAATVFRRSSIR